MKIMFWTCIVWLLSTLYITTTNATTTECKVSTYGTEFVFGFLDLPFYNSSFNPRAWNPDLSVIVSLRGGTNVYITTYSTGSASKTPIATTKTQYVYQYEEFHFNSTFINKYQDTSPGRRIMIRADDPISVMTIYDMYPYKVANPILPSTALSTSYVIPSYQPNTVSKSAGQFLVISLNESTEVRFEGYETGNMVYPLSKEEIYVYERAKDLSSTTVSSNHPVALFSSVMPGNLHNLHTNSNPSSVFLSMQVPPMDRHAKHFIVPPLVDDQVQHYKVRIYAPVQNAFVEIHSSSDSTQKVHVYHKIFYELTTDCTNVLEIVSDQPILVVQVALVGDTALFMTSVPATSQYLNSYTTAGLDVKHVTPSTTLSRQIVITIPFSEASGLIINGRPMEHNPTEVSQRTPQGNFTVLTFKTSGSLSTITHVNSVPFGLLVVGQWQDYLDYCAYGFWAGMQFTKDCPSGPSQTGPSGSFVG